MKVDIYGVTYKINEVTQDKIKEVHNGNLKEDDLVYGLCDYYTCDIYIDESMTKEKKERILTHEITHAIIHELGYTKFDIEKICDFIGAHNKLINKIVSVYHIEGGL